MMTKKDFELLADAMAPTKPHHRDSTTDAARFSYWTWSSTVCNVANQLKNKYPRFNREKFLSRCGVDA